MKEEIKVRVEAVERFLSRFPDETDWWGQATDELADLHNSFAERAVAYVGNIYQSKGGTLPDAARRDPGLRNRSHKAGIRGLMQVLPEREIEAVLDHYKEWLK